MGARLAPVQSPLHRHDDHYDDDHDDCDDDDDYDYDDVNGNVVIIMRMKSSFLFDILMR